MSKDLKNKIIMLGDSGVGKTSLVRQWVQHAFDDGFTTPTIGSAYAQTVFTFNGHQEKIQIWDTAGEEKYRAMAPIYSQNAFGAIIVFDMTNKTTMEHIADWIECISQDIPIILAGNKSDLSPVISNEEVLNCAEELGLDFYPTSAATGLNVVQLFENLLQKSFEKRELLGAKLSVDSQIDVNNSKEDGKDSCC